MTGGEARIESLEMNNKEEDLKLLIFGWIETVLGTPKDLNPDQYNRLTDKLYDLFASQKQHLLDKAEKTTASKIFSLAHEYAQNDPDMKGSEELRFYHYYNAIHKIGEFDGR